MSIKPSRVEKALRELETFRHVSPRGYGGGRITHVTVHYACNSKVEIDGRKFARFLKSAQACVEARRKPVTRPITVYK